MNEEPIPYQPSDRRASFRNQRTPAIILVLLVVVLVLLAGIIGYAFNLAR